jgi:hypothetical protein
MDSYLFLSFRQIHVVVYGTTSNYLTFRINFIIFVRTPCMNRARTKLLITLGNRYFYLSVAPWSRTKFYKLRVQKEKPAVFLSHPHTVGPARRSSGNACGVAFSLTSGTAVEQTDYRQTPTPPTARWLRKQEGEEMAVARTPRKLVSDGTRVGGVCRTARHEC